MPRLIYAAAAIADLDRLRRFLTAKSPAAARRAGQVLREALSVLEAAPEIGRPVEDLPEFRELLVPFGDSGYVVRYRLVPEREIVVILAIRHQREAGF